MPNIIFTFFFLITQQKYIMQNIMLFFIELRRYGLAELPPEDITFVIRDYVCDKIIMLG